MNPAPQSMGLSGPKRWHASLVLFLAFLVPVSPLLAQIQQDAASRDSIQSSTPAPSVTSLRHQLSPTLIALDLFGQRDFLELDGPPSFLGTDTKACDKGRSDADWETDGTLWFILGLTLMIWGPVLAYVISPSVPEEHIKGKTASYAAAYADCYKDVAKAIHVKWAWLGVAALAVLAGIFFIVLLLANKGMSN